MKIGYPCINLTVGCKGTRTFRLKSYSEEKLALTIDNNLSCLLEILQFNAKHNIFFFRITSDLVPFASHPVCKFNWQSNFKDRFSEIGAYIEAKKMRISMHPGQYTVLNTPTQSTLDNSIADLLYHVEVLDAMDLDTSAKIQIHVGGMYGNKQMSITRFCERYRYLPEIIKRRLVIENDDRSYSLSDCLEIYEVLGIPVLFDSHHHELKNAGEKIQDAIEMSSRTWKSQDGIPMIDYSHRRKMGTPYAHIDTLVSEYFKLFLE
jgi:UV DNA damage endonuclease